MPNQYTRTPRKKPARPLRKNNSGRLTILETRPDVIDALIGYIEDGNYFDDACHSAGMSDGTFYSYMDLGRSEKERLDSLIAEGKEAVPDPEMTKYLKFLERVKVAKGKAVSSAVGHVRAAMKENWQAAMTFLERRDPERWGRRDATYHEHKHAHSGQVDVVHSARGKITDRIERLSSRRAAIPADVVKED